MNEADIKKRLKHFREMALEVKYQKLRLRLFEPDISPKIVVCENNDLRSVKDKLCLFDDKATIEAEIKRIADILEQEYQIFNKAIMRCNNSEMKIIFQLRYFHLYDWNDINEFLYSRRDDYLTEKNSKYERRMFRLHKQALKTISDTF